MTTTQPPVDALMALIRAFSNCSPGDEDEALEEIETSARALAAIPAKRCPYCDDTGDVHSIDGEWRGRCTCPAGQYAPTPPTAPAQDAQGERNAQMLIDIGNAALRAGWNGVDLQAFVIGRLASPSPSAVQPLSDGDFAFLDDDGKQMMITSHHYTVKDIKALIDDLKAVEQGIEQPEWVNRDHRTRCGVIWRVMAALASDVPVAPLPEAERQDSARLDAMQLHRISVVPEYEGPWDARVYGNEGEPEAVGTGSTPREAIDNAIAAHGIITKEST